MFTYALFNRWSWIAQLKLLDWLSGDVSAVQPPEPYLTQKNRDWLSDFVTSYPVNVSGGSIARPSDYYLYQDLYSLNADTDCDGNEEVTVIKTPVTLLDNSKFNQRTKTWIKSLKPSLNKPIVKQVGTSFIFEPSDIGSVVLEYIRYPKKAFIGTKIDLVYQQQVPDTDNTIDFEWNEMSRPLLVWYIVDSFANRTRENALKQGNLITGKTTREGK
jgi:hypothetical protein